MKPANGFIVLSIHQYWRNDGEKFKEDNSIQFFSNFSVHWIQSLGFFYDSQSNQKNH